MRSDRPTEEDQPCQRQCDPAQEDDDQGEVAPARAWRGDLDNLSEDLGGPPRPLELTRRWSHRYSPRQTSRPGALRGSSIAGRGKLAWRRLRPRALFRTGNRKRGELNNTDCLLRPRQPAVHRVGSAGSLAVPIRGMPCSPTTRAVMCESSREVVRRDGHRLVASDRDSVKADAPAASRLAFHLAPHTHLCIIPSCWVMVPFGTGGNSLILPIPRVVPITDESRNARTHLARPGFR